MSTRGRILGWFMVIVATALLLTVVLVAESLYALARQDVADELQHETFKFRTFSAAATDPATGLPYTDPGRLLRAYLAEAVPDKEEMLFSVVDGRPGHRTRGERDVRLDLDPTVIAAADAATEPLTRAITTAEGPAVFAVIPVRSEASPARAALVIVELLGARHDHVLRTIWTVGLVSLLALVAAWAASWFVAGRVLAPISQVRDAARAISESDLTARIPTDERGPNDDVARLASTFNHMLDRIERAFATQRQFLDDAAHELRTPLTVIRGHLELPDHERSEEQRALLLDEVDRMDRMVDDLLVLAKAERPDFLNREPVDLTDLVVSVAAKARLLGDRAWGVPAAVGCTIVADGQRLTQALMQLVANAIACTEPGDAIHIWSRLAGDAVELNVADAGPGIPVSERESVFGRFHRGSSSTSTGLGLAIVATIAQAHGGGVRVGDSSLGGAQFTIWLPGRSLDLVCPDEIDDEEDLP